MALNVDKVYRFCQFVTNKESRGYFSPAEFNLAAELAQIDAYSKRETVFLQTKRILNDMRPFMKLSAAIIPATGLCAYPADMRHFIRGWMDADYNKITELTQAELADAMTSEVVPPTADYPAGVQRDTGFQLYPITISNDIRVEHLVGPTAPYWDYNLVGNRPEYNSGGSTVQFQFDDILFLEISASILLHVGLNLKEDNVTQYGMAFNQGK